MSLRVMDEIVGRAIRDASFRELLLTETDRALEGYHLDDEERADFAALDKVAALELYPQVRHLFLSHLVTA